MGRFDVDIQNLQQQKIKMLTLYNSIEVLCNQL